MTTDPDLTIIDEFGVQAVADALEISREAVRKWRIKGTIPNHRRQELRGVAFRMNDSCTDGQSSWPTWLPMVVGQASTVQSDRLVDLDAITGLNAAFKAEEVLAKRDAHLAGQHVSELSTSVNDHRLDTIIRAYGLRLVGLFALDFPVLTMAFVTVAKVSPIVAAGSAIALSLFLVLGAHLLGGVLRAASTSIPIWCRHLSALLVLITFLATIVWVTLDLRLKGLEFDGVTSVASSGLVFGDTSDQAGELPRSFELALGRAAALVTVGSLLFGVAWSYRRHGSASTKMSAETTYRRRLRRLARRRARLARLEHRAKKAAMAAVIIVAIASSVAQHGLAATCEGETVLALIDTTTAYDDVDRASIIPVIERMASSLKSGQQLLVRTVRDAPDSSWLLFSGCVPPELEMSWSFAGIWTWLTTNPSALRADREAFFADMRDALLPQFRLHGDTSRSALVDTLERLAEDVDGLATIWLFSDLLESSVVRAEGLLAGNSSILIQGRGRLAELEDINVHMAGFGRFHDATRRSLSTQEQASLIDSWTLFIQQSGGQLHVEQPSEANVSE